MEPQVALEHYDFETYITKARWSSYWHQLRLVLETAPQTCLVVGKGDGIVPVVLQQLGVAATTLDFDQQLKAEIIGDVRAIPLADSAVDVLLAAQVLEHLHWEDVPRALAELKRVARRRVIISVPQRGRSWAVAIKPPLMRPFAASGVLPARTPHRYDGHHYWELDARSTTRRDFETLLHASFPSFSSFVVKDNPYHRFYVSDLD
jgi:SAM-dependent methyltransferase